MAEVFDLLPPGDTWIEKGEALLNIEYFGVNVHPGAAAVLGLAAEVYIEFQSRENTWAIVPDLQRFEEMEIYLSKLISAGKGRLMWLPPRGLLLGRR